MGMRRFAIIGCPIRHSLSPVMHTAAFQALGLAAAYTALEVTPAQLRRVLAGLEALGMDGLNVTVPHKERALRCVAASGQLDDTARQVGAVNTLIWEHGRWVGRNTDVEGIERTLRDELRCEARGTRVLVVGAGGAARAVVWALARRQPACLTITNRTPSKAHALRRWLRRIAPAVRVEVLPYERRRLSARLPETDLLVNATSLGLHAGDPLPVDAAALHKRLAVFDLVYPEPSRRTTPLVAAARRRGALAVDGVPMLVYQGAASFGLWWERPAPVAVMRRAVEGALRQRR